ncbi:MAG: hypothetical protein V1487_00695 [bacterium]
MPDVQYDQTTTPKTRRFHLPRLKFGKFGRTLGIILITILLNLGAAVIAGFISAFSSNIDVNSLSLIFDPQITIAYVLVYYSFVHFYKLTTNQSYLYLIFVLLLSFTTNFIQGSITMIVLPPLLKKLKLIDTAPPA